MQNLILRRIHKKREILTTIEHQLEFLFDAQANIKNYDFNFFVVSIKFLLSDSAYPLKDYKSILLHPVDNLGLIQTRG